MKKVIIVLCALLIGSFALADETDYRQIYQDLEVPTFKYVHGIDPGELYDTRNSSWSPYPLFRLTSPIFFKSITIEPGYYLLTPREHKGNWYILFKEAGTVKYTVPVYKRDIVPEMFYDENLPKAKLTPSQKFHINALNLVGKIFPSSKREPTPQTYLELTELENNFLSVVIYWGDHRYYTLFRTIQL